MHHVGPPPRLPTCPFCDAALLLMPFVLPLPDPSHRGGAPLPPSATLAMLPFLPFLLCVLLSPILVERPLLYVCVIASILTYSHYLASACRGEGLASVPHPGSSGSGRRGTLGAAAFGEMGAGPTHRRRVGHHLLHRCSPFALIAYLLPSLQCFLQQRKMSRQPSA